MAKGATAITEAAEPDLVITRVFEAPPDMVFKTKLTFQQAGCASVARAIRTRRAGPGA